MADAEAQLEQDDAAYLAAETLAALAEAVPDPAVPNPGVIIQAGAPEQVGILLQVQIRAATDYLNNQAGQPVAGQPAAPAAPANQLAAGELEVTLLAAANPAAVRLATAIASTAHPGAQVKEAFRRVLNAPPESRVARILANPVLENNNPGAANLEVIDIVVTRIRQALELQDPQNPEITSAVRLVATVLAIAHPKAAALAVKVIEATNSAPADLEAAKNIAKDELLQALGVTAAKGFPASRCNRFDEYVIQSASANDDAPDYIHYRRLFRHAVGHFRENNYNPQGSIDSYLNELAGLPGPFWSYLFGDLPAATVADRKSIAKGRILSILGTWLGLSPLFRQSTFDQRPRPILLGNSVENQSATERDLTVSLKQLLNDSPCILKRPVFIIPDGKDTDSILESFESTNTEGNLLNILTLQNYTNVELLWVNNISRHLILSQRTGHTVLEIFGFPDVIRTETPLDETHQFVCYMREVLWSYPLLFPGRDSPGKVRSIIDKAQARFGRGIDFEAVYDALNRQQNIHSWNSEDFPFLWPRIVKMRDFQDKANPATWWQLWKDRRNPVQYYGTIFAFVVIPFSIITIGLAAATLAYAIKGPNTKV